MGGRYAVFDVEYDAEGGEGQRSKITFISWVPDDANLYVRTMPASCVRSKRQTDNFCSHE